MKREGAKPAFHKTWLFVTGLLFAIALMLGSSCSTDADLKEESVPFEILRAVPVFSTSSEQQDIVSCEFNTSIIDMDSVNASENLSRLELVIDNPEDLTTYIICADTITVDFEVEFILAGMTTYQPTQVRIKEQTVELANDSLYYHIGLINTYLTTPSSAEYMVKVLSKNYLEYPVVFDIYWEEER